MTITAWACVAVGVLLTAGYAVMGATNHADAIPLWLYFTPAGLATVPMWIRLFANPTHRRSWTLLTVGLTIWVLGDVWAVTLGADSTGVSFGSAMFTVGYVLLMLGAWTAIPGRRGADGIESRLSGYVAGVTAAALVVALMLDGVGVVAKSFSSFVDTTWFIGLAVITIATVTARLGLAGWYPGRQLGVICAAVAINAGVDLTYLSPLSTQHPELVKIMDVAWLACFMLFAVAALLPTDTSVQRLQITWRDATVPNTWLGIALALVVLDGVAFHVPVAATILATVALLLGGARAAVVFGAHLKLLEYTRQEARHDALTGLANRRALMEDLEHAFEAGDSMRLVLCDLNGFKAYNDTRGHQEGDRLLARLGDRLDRLVAGRGRAYRLGGDEFCVLWPLPNDLMVQDVEHALSEPTGRAPITTAYGDVELPLEAPDVTSALRISDARMYARKAEQRPSHHAA